jgi:ubiquinone/menaquinone biosynthesis C-methylase UbiE
MADSTAPKTPLTPEQIKSGVANSYDAIAKRYLEWAEPYHAVSINQIDKILPYLTSKDHAEVLELGCGAGVPGTLYLASHENVHVTANDISSAQLALARQKLVHGRASLVEGDMMSLDFEAGSFDAVVSLYSIFHLPRDEQVTMVQKVAKWLRPGGYFLCCFNVDGGEGVQASWLGAWMYWSGWGVEKSMEIVAQAGLVVKEKNVTINEEDGDGKGKREIPFLWVVAVKPEET